MGLAHGVEYVLQGATQFPVAPVAHRLQVYLVGVGPGAQVVENLGGGVTVRHARGVQTRSLRQTKNLGRPLGRYERFVVGRDDEPRPPTSRELDDRTGTDVPRSDTGGFVAQRLRRQPVLAVVTVEIATQHPEGDGIRAGENVEERLLLCGIALQRNDVAPRDHKRAGVVEAHSADAAAARPDHAAQRACRAAQGTEPSELVQLAGSRPPVELVGECRQVSTSSEYSNPRLEPREGRVGLAGSTRSALGLGRCGR